MKRFFKHWSNWENWPFKVVYFPLSFIWAWYCLKARSFWFFSPSNPSITFGGFEGEGKREMYDQLPAGTYPETLYIQPGISVSALKEQLKNSTIQYPFIVKPDIGMKGILFRKLDTEAQLLDYHQKMPVVYLIQALLEHPIELSVFYYRYPDAPKGVISGMIQKELLEVTGDGERCLWDLIMAHPRAKFRVEEMQALHGHRSNLILSKGERFYLSYAGNHNRGARFINLIDEVDEKLLGVFDGLSMHTKHFYYGRYDIKCNSIAALKEGKEFMILEFNGAGAEPNHIYDSGISLGAAYREILRHWKALYEISASNRKKGIEPWSFLKGWRFLKESGKHFKRLEALDLVFTAGEPAINSEGGKQV